MTQDIQRTLVLIKPDGIQRGLAGPIISRFEARGLQIVALKMLQMDRTMANQHYGIHKDRPFFEGLVDFISSNAIIAMVLQGSNAVELVRSTMGTTDPVQAEAGTIRGDLATNIGRNLVHGSDSLETAASEIALFFTPKEILDYPREIASWITEP